MKAGQFPLQLIHTSVAVRMVKRDLDTRYNNGEIDQKARGVGVIIFIFVQISQNKL